MKNFRDSLKSSGYDHQEAYFYQRDRELIEKLRAKNGRGRPKLLLLEGGNQSSANQQARPRNQSARKAA
ncbi:MAG TPA: hypothetical protein VM432_10230 [Bdellovibrionales bacterium]|nr:hypothetical protein [Bdellovibrionales bacterium]